MQPVSRGNLVQCGITHREELSRNPATNIPWLVAFIAPLLQSRRSVRACGPIAKAPQLARESALDGTLQLTEQTLLISVLTLIVSDALLGEPVTG